MITMADLAVFEEILKMAALATEVINEHTDCNGLCAVCGSAWPCQRAVVADHNLGLL
jgi:hypothetical protein